MTASSQHKLDKLEASHGLKPLGDWSLAEAAQVMNAELRDEARDRRFGAISTDSRSVASGEVFLAIQGEQFDGHEFCAGAAERGAAALIVRESFASDLDDRLPVLRVADTLRAYGDLAAHQRRMWGGPVIAISGSVGKTTTRRLVARTLAASLNVLEPVRNFNNLIGLPQTLLRLESTHDIAVLELGMNQPGELRRLAEIAAPSVSALTRIGRAHIGLFGSMDELIQAKLDLLEATAQGRPLVLNAGCPHCAEAAARLAASHPITTFSGEGGRAGDDAVKSKPDCTIENVRPIAPVGYTFDLVTSSGRMADLRLAHFGRHILEDVAAAAAICIAAGFEPDALADVVGSFEAEPLRGQIVEAGDWTFILDCYNAAPESVAGALRSMGELPPGGRIVIVLTDMLELGDCSVQIHHDLGPILRDLAPDAIYCTGEQMSDLARTLAAEGMHARAAPDLDAMIDFLRAELRAGDRVLFKGAHSFALENVARALAPQASIPG